MAIILPSRAKSDTSFGSALKQGLASGLGQATTQLPMQVGGAFLDDYLSRGRQENAMELQAKAAEDAKKKASEEALGQLVNEETAYVSARGKEPTPTQTLPRNGKGILSDMMGMAPASPATKLAVDDAMSPIPGMYGPLMPEQYGPPKPTGLSNEPAPTTVSDTKGANAPSSDSTGKPVRFSQGGRKTQTTQEAGYLGNIGMKAIEGLSETAGFGRKNANLVASKGSEAYDDEPLLIREQYLLGQMPSEKDIANIQDEGLRSKVAAERSSMMRELQGVRNARTQLQKDASRFADEFPSWLNPTTSATNVIADGVKVKEDGVIAGRGSGGGGRGSGLSKIKDWSKPDRDQIAEFAAAIEQIDDETIRAAYRDRLSFAVASGKPQELASIASELPGRAPGSQVGQKPKATPQLSAEIQAIDKEMVEITKDRTYPRETYEKDPARRPLHNRIEQLREYRRQLVGNLPTGGIEGGE